MLCRGSREHPDERDEAVEWIFKNGSAGAQELQRLKRHGVE